MKQIGLPYVWGGNGPENGHRGFDCSGLTTFAYDKAGVDLPRTAHTQFRHGPRVPGGAPLQPGDLVFYGTYQKVQHVGMYIGSGRMVNAPTFGKPVQTAWYRYTGDNYLGATRPAGTGTGAVPAPDPAVPEQPDPTIPDVPEFPAPPAPPLAVVPDPRAPQPPQARSAADSLAAAGPALSRPATVPVAAGPAPAPGARPEGRPDATAPGGSTPAAPSTPRPSPPPTRPSTPMPTPPPSSVPPPTSPKPTPSTSPPTTSVPPPTTPAPPAQRVHAVTLVDAGTIRATPPVRLGRTGLPVSPGSWAGPAGWVLRLPSALAAAPGTVVTVQLADGTTRAFTVQQTRTVPTATAAATQAPLVVVVPAGGGAWAVTTAR